MFLTFMFLFAFIFYPVVTSAITEAYFVFHKYGMTLQGTINPSRNFVYFN